MRIRPFFVSIAALLTSACGGPIVLLPGGELSGTPGTPPAEWQSVPDTVQVEFRSTDPYSINIWGVGIERDFYIATGDGGTRWTDMLTADPGVRLQLGDTLFALTAARVDDVDERVRVIARYVAKYELDADGEWVQDGLIYRLDRR